MTEVRITEYQDVFSTWYGLPDGTLLGMDDPTGWMWVKSGKEVMPVEEWNRRQDAESPDPDWKREA